MIQALNKVILLGAVAREPLMREQNGVAQTRLQVAGIGNQSDGIGWSHTISVYGDQMARSAASLLPGHAVFIEGGFFYQDQSKSDEKVSTLRIRASRVMHVERAPEDSFTDPSGQHWLRCAINEVVIAGNATRNAIERSRKEGERYLIVPLALNESWRDKSGEIERRVHFVPIICGSNTQAIAGLVQKSEPLLVVGEVMSLVRPDPNKAGKMKTNVQVRARTIELLGNLIKRKPLTLSVDAVAMAAD